MESLPEPDDIPAAAGATVRRDSYLAMWRQTQQRCCSDGDPDGEAGLLYWMSARTEVPTAVLEMLILAAADVTIRLPCRG